MRPSTENDHYCTRSIGASVPRQFAAAIHSAVRARGETLADFVRSALSEKLTRDGIPHQAPPRLRRKTYLHG